VPALSFCVQPVLALADKGESSGRTRFLAAADGLRRLSQIRAAFNDWIRDFVFVPKTVPRRFRAALMGRSSGWQAYG